MHPTTAGRAGLAGILGANALTLLVALWQQWPLVLLLWPFWIQSVLIGWYARKRIRARFDLIAANGFAIHYGIFHGAYLGFLLEQSGRVRAMDWLGIIVAGIAFSIAHMRSHGLNVDADARAQRGLGALIAIPYARIVPMHLCAGLAFLADQHAVSVQVLVGFTALKTGVDVLMHVLEHRWLQQAPAAA